MKSTCFVFEVAALMLKNGLSTRKRRSFTLLSVNWYLCVLDLLSTIADINRAAKLAMQMGISRQGLYKTLSENGNPEFATIQKLITALGLQMSIITPAKPMSKRKKYLAPQS